MMRPSWNTARHLDTRCRDCRPLLPRSLIQSLRGVHLRVFPFLGLLNGQMLFNPLFKRFKGIKMQNLANEQIERIGVELFQVGA
jgi:hypothetical protein